MVQEVGSIKTTADTEYIYIQMRYIGGAFILRVREIQNICIYNIHTVCLGSVDPTFIQYKMGQDFLDRQYIRCC